MAQAGGPAAINGFLYQIIQHLGWLADVALSGSLDGQEIEEACLVLEPRSGGDARAEASGIYLVEQYKTRRGGTWAVSDIPSILRDLRKAVPPSLHREFYEATFALAALGADAALVETIQSGGVTAVSVYLAELRSHEGPISKSLTKQALEVLRDDASTEDALLPALTVAWLSDDADLIPEVRAALTRANLEGRIAAYACMALGALGDSSDEFAQLAQGLLHTDKNESWGLNALIGMGSEDSIWSDAGFWPGTRPIEPTATTSRSAYCTVTPRRGR